MRLIKGLGTGVVAVGVLSASAALAELFPMANRASLLPAVSQAPGDAVLTARAPSASSLFAGKSSGSLFAPVALPRAVPDNNDMGLGALALPNVLTDGGPIANLRNLIAKAEAGAKGYDAVQYGATIKPVAPPTAMSVQQIYDWIDATPGQPHAIGRYQFIPATLRRLVKRAGLDPKVRFSPQVQDVLADLLLADAGIEDFLAGKLPRHSFMNNLAKIWAGLPNHTGQSHYHGYAGNKATMTWATFDAAMVRIFSG